MNLPDDLKNYEANDSPLGAFQLLTGDACVILLCILILVAGICPEILR